MAPHAHGERGRQLLRNLWAYLVICCGHFPDVLHAGPVQFRTGWFVESLATQTLIIFAIRTRRVPFFRSRPGLVLTLAAFAVVAVGVTLTVSPLAHQLGFTTLPWQFFTAVVLFTIVDLVFVEMMKTVF
jgi:Mg2+-importing ATPase